jgi:hypothetical protein
MKSDYFRIGLLHSLIDFYNSEGARLLRGTESIYKYIYICLCVLVTLTVGCSYSVIVGDTIYAPVLSHSSLDW